MQTLWSQKAPKYDYLIWWKNKSAKHYQRLLQLKNKKEKRQTKIEKKSQILYHLANVDEPVQLKSSLIDQSCDRFEMLWNNSLDKVGFRIAAMLEEYNWTNEKWCENDLEDLKYTLPNQIDLEMSIEEKNHSLERVWKNEMWCDDLEDMLPTLLFSDKEMSRYLNATGVEKFSFLFTSYNIQDLNKLKEIQNQKKEIALIFDEEETLCYESECFFKAKMKINFQNETTNQWPKQTEILFLLNHMTWILDINFIAQIFSLSLDFEWILKTFNENRVFSLVNSEELVHFFQKSKNWRIGKQKIWFSGKRLNYLVNLIKNNEDVNNEPISFEFHQQSSLKEFLSILALLMRKKFIFYPSYQEEFSLNTKLFFDKAARDQFKLFLKLTLMRRKFLLYFQRMKMKRWNVKFRKEIFYEIFQKMLPSIGCFLEGDYLNGKINAANEDLDITTTLFIL